MRASIRTTRRNSPERGSPGRIPCLVSCYGKCIPIIATCYPKYEYYATSCRVGGRYRRVAYYDGVGRFVNKRSEEHTSELQSRPHLVCRLLLEKKKKEVER